MTDEQLWDRWRASGTVADRNALVDRYYSLVQFVAGRVKTGLPRSVEHSDLVNYGVFGLIDAINKFDPVRGYKFETYAISRIRGAIIDELREIDAAPRAVRAKARAHEQTFDSLEARLGRRPTQIEVADELGVSVDEYRGDAATVRDVQHVSLEDTLRWHPNMTGDSTEQPARVGEILEDRTAVPASSYAVEEIRESLVAALGQMSRREQILLHLYYREDLSLPKISVIFGVTPSRASQIHTQAVATLWAKLRAAA